MIINSKVREAKRITPSDVRAAADCLRTLGFEQDKNQIRTSEGRVRLWRKNRCILKYFARCKLTWYYFCRINRQTLRKEILWRISINLLGLCGSAT